MSKQLKVLCGYKNIEVAGTFVCSIEPRDGKYIWFLTKNGETFGGEVPSQDEAMMRAFEVLRQKKI